MVGIEPGAPGEEPGVGRKLEQSGLCWPWSPVLDSPRGGTPCRASEQMPQDLTCLAGWSSGSRWEQGHLVGNVM